MERMEEEKEKELGELKEVYEREKGVVKEELEAVNATAENYLSKLKAAVKKGKKIEEKEKHLEKEVN